MCCLLASHDISVMTFFLCGTDGVAHAWDAGNAWQSRNLFIERHNS